jgi:hypothetical protein
MQLAREIGKEAGQWIWDHRHLFEVDIKENGVASTSGSTDVHTSASAIEAALALDVDRPVCKDQHNLRFSRSRPSGNHGDDFVHRYQRDCR